LPGCSGQGRKVGMAGKLNPSKPTTTAKAPDGKRPPKTVERPARGRRRTIAEDMGIPYRAVVLALRNWNQARGRDLRREELFSEEKLISLL
jgi:hypothetical protein